MHRPLRLCAALVGWVLIVALTSCSMGQTLEQGNTLPSLHALDWGYHGEDYPQWSPNGKWILALLSEDYANGDWTIVSPDGKYRKNLHSIWQLSDDLETSCFWFENNMAGCITPDSWLIYAAYPFSQPMTVRLNLRVFPITVSTTPGDQYFIVASGSQPTNSLATELPVSSLYVVRRDGTVTATPLVDGADYPALVPNQAALSYIQGTALVKSQIISDGQTITLGPPEVIENNATDVAYDVVSTYAWSPSGNWVALRYANYRSGDKIYLVNAHNPQQTVDVVLADHVGQQMTDPIWSPDGTTLMVFGVNDGRPYTIDIANFLKQKGLQP